MKKILLKSQTNKFGFIYKFDKQNIKFLKKKKVFLTNQKKLS